GYAGDRLSKTLQKDLVSRLRGWYREHPDPGLHSAIDWLLGHGQEGRVGRQLDWEQADVLKRIDQELQGQPPGDRRWYGPAARQTMVLLGPEELDMGSPADEPNREKDETLHRRRIGRTFALATREVTARQFAEFLKACPSVKHKSNRKYNPDDDCPEVNV